MNTQIVNSKDVANEFLANGVSTWNVVCACKKCLNKAWVVLDIATYAEAIEGFDAKEIKKFNHELVQLQG